jgi:hypothetical protein
MAGSEVNDTRDQGTQGQGVKQCASCLLEKPRDGFNRDDHSSDGLSSFCKGCSRLNKQEWQRNENRKRKEEIERQKLRRAQTNPETLIAKLESGEWTVSQKWLLTELIQLYSDPRTKDPLAVLKMIANISGYDKDSGDEAAVINSLMESMKQEKRDS